MADLWTPASYRDQQSGYNMPSGPGVEDDRPGVTPGGGSFWDRIKAKTADVGGRVAAGASAWGEARQQGFSFGDTTSPAMKAGLNAYDPTGRAEANWAKTKWAFRGTRTTPNPQSEAREQNIYGGVQRDVIPTRRISTQPMGTPNVGEGLTRERLNKEAYESSVYPMVQHPGVPSGASQGPPPPMQQMGMPMGPGPPTMPSPMSADPLFAKNTGQVPYNQAQFGSVHSRAVAGSQ